MSMLWPGSGALHDVRTIGHLLCTLSSDDDKHLAAVECLSLRDIINLAESTLSHWGKVVKYKTSEAWRVMAFEQTSRC